MAKTTNRNKTSSQLATTKSNQKLVVENTVQMDIQLTADNLADLPAGRFEDMLDDLREQLQTQQADAQRQKVDIETRIKAETKALAATYTHPSAAALVKAMGAFTSEPYDVLIVADRCDLAEAMVEISINVLSAADKVVYLDKSESEDHKTGYRDKSRYSDFPEISAEVELPFGPELLQLKAELAAVSEQLVNMHKQLTKVETAYSRLPKIRDRARRRITEATLQGKMRSNDDVMEMLEELIPAETSKLPQIAFNNG